jgi:hypothetical protein
MQTSISKHWAAGRGLVSAAALAASALFLAGQLALAADNNKHDDSPARPPENALADIRCSELAGELGSEWYQWSLSIPPMFDPVADPVGTNAGVGQKGSVWFLCGSWGVSNVVRTITVPGDRLLFFPLVDIAWVSTPGQPFLPGVPEPKWDAPFTDTSVTPPKHYKAFADYARAYVKDWVNAKTTSCEVDGKKVHGVRAHSAADFYVCLGPGVWGFDLGYYGPSPSTTDGVWVLLPRLAPGEHTIHIAAQNNDGAWGLDVTYKLTVAPVMKVK